MPSLKTTVVNVRNGGVCDIYVGRPSPWGNPFVANRDGTREEVIEKYRTWLARRPDLIARLGELQGKRLGCWCHPLPCHADILAELADAQHAQV